MSEASCMYTFPYDLVVRHTLVCLSRKVVRISIMRKNILSSEYYVFMGDFVFVDGCFSQF